jgi:hypothetical protein
MTKRIMTFLSIASTVCHMKRLMGRVRQGERRCVKSGLIDSVERTGRWPSFGRAIAW